MDTLGPLNMSWLGIVLRVNNTYLYEVETWSSVLMWEVASFEEHSLRGVPQ